MKTTIAPPVKTKEPATFSLTRPTHKDVKKKKTTMRALLIYPEFPVDSYWNHYLLNQKIFSDNEHGYPKAVMPPLGLLCIINVLIERYGRENIRLIDMNTRALKEEDVLWSTEVYLSAMLTQSKSFDKVAALAKSLGKTTIGGGPYVSEHTPNLDYVFINEAEKTLEPFLDKLFENEDIDIDKIQSGEKPGNDDFYRPDYTWINPKDYSSLSIQFSRGCPHDCEFCDITQRYGRKMRTKNVEIFLEELDWMYKTGWRGPVFIIDDNFIGKPKDALDLLKEVAVWQKERDYPFQFYTQATILLAEDRFEELLKSFYPAGFTMIFLGIETPNEVSLKETNKLHNLRGAGTLAEKIKKIQTVGKVIIFGGFIVGFDSDDETIFDRQEKFINEEIKIPTPMIGILEPLPHTHLDTRLKKENRLTSDPSGKIASGVEVNFVPVGMDKETLKTGYVDLLKRVYLDKKKFYARCFDAVNLVGKPLFKGAVLRKDMMGAMFKLIFHLGIKGKDSWQFWKFIGSVILTNPSRIMYAFRLSAYGLHYQILTEKRVKEFEIKKKGN